MMKLKNMVNIAFAINEIIIIVSVMLMVYIVLAQFNALDFVLANINVLVQLLIMAVLEIADHTLE